MMAAINRPVRTVPTRATLVAATATIGALLFAVGCGGSDQPDSKGQGTPDKPTPISIAVSNYPSTSTSPPYVVAQKRGMFKAQGIKIDKVSGSSGGGATVRAVLAGRLPFGEVATSAAVQAKLAGAPIAIVGGAVQSVADINFVVPKQSPLRSIDDLSGATIGFTEPGSVTQAVLELSLRRAKVAPSKVKTRAMAGLTEGLTALDGGGIDVAPNVEPVYSSNSDPYRVLWEVTDYMPEYQQTVIITSRETVERRPGLVKRFLTARAKALDWIEQNQAAAAEDWSDASELKLDVSKKVIRDYVKQKQWGVGVTLGGLRQADESMHLLGQVKGAAEIPWSEVVDQSQLPAGTPKIDVDKIATSN